MKHTIIAGIITWIFSSLLGFNADAQTIDIVGDNDKPKETQEIIIRKKGDKDTKFTIEISSDKILVNGKPIAEFNEDGLTINNRKVIVRDGNKMTFDFGKKFNDDLEKNFEFNIDKNFNGNLNEDENTRMEKSYTFLGVATKKTDDGAAVLEVTKNSPADKGGLLKDDIIYKINDSKIEEPSSLANIIRAMKPGDKVKVYFLRNGKKKDEKITLGENKTIVSKRTFSFSGPDGSVKTLIIPKPPMPPTPPGFDQNWNKNFDENVFEPRRPKLGLKIQDTEDGNAVKVLDVEPGSASATAGLLKDDLIVEIGSVKVQNTDDARSQLMENSDKSSYTIKAKRNGSEMTFTIKIPKKLKTANL